MYKEIIVVLLVLALTINVVPVLGEPIVTAPEDVYQALGINARDYSRGDPFEPNNDIKIVSFNLTDARRESDGRVVFSFVVVLKIDHVSALHGHPNPSEDDWEDPWNYQFMICIGYGEKRIVDVAINDYFGLTSSKKPFNELSFNRVGSLLTSYKSMEARWINKTSKFNTLEELIAYYKSSTESYSNKSYWVSGVLEIKAVDVKFPVTIRYEDLDKIKLYAAIRGWSGPGDMSGPLWWLLAYDTMDITDLFRQKLQGSQEASSGGSGEEGETSVPSYTPSGGYGELFSNAFLRYRLYFHANVTGYTGEKHIDNWVVSDAEYHMRIKDFSNGDFYVNASTVGLRVEGSDYDMKNLAYKVYSGLNISKQTSISDFSRGLQYFTRFMNSYLLRLNIYDVDHDGVFTWYKGVPAVRYTITGSGVTYLEGDSYNYEVNVTSYYDTFMGLPLYINGTIHLFDRKEDSWIDFRLTLSVELLDGLDYFPRQESIPSITCTLMTGNQAYIGLEASNAKIIEAEIDDDSDLLLIVSGTGSGSLIIVTSGDDEVEYVWIDGEQVDYLKLVNITNETTIVIVPLTLSQHQVKISFTRNVYKLGPVGQQGEEIGEQTAPQTVPQTSIVAQPGNGSPSTEKPVETIIPTNLLGDLWLIIVIVVIVVAVIGGLVFVFTRGRRRRQPYYLPPPPPPPY